LRNYRKQYSHILSEYNAEKNLARIAAKRKKQDDKVLRKAA
jgi:hypothetical protein